jgi:phosphoglycolate phosphatase-like HAD superfamily hydrolase
MVGDSWRDVEAGKAAGCRTIQIAPVNKNGDTEAIYICSNLSEAVEFIVKAR